MVNPLEKYVGQSTGNEHPYRCRVELVQTNENAIMPERNVEDSGFDFFSTQDIWLHPGQRELIQTGWRISIQAGWEGQVRSRSGMSINKGIVVLNAPGTIDASYSGPCGIILYNASTMPYHVQVGSKIAQIVFMEVPTTRIFVVKEFTTKQGTRGEAGFGSTGAKFIPAGFIKYGQ